MIILNTVFIVLIACFTIVLLYTIYLWFRLKGYNQKPLCIKTFDNSNSPYHPSVVYYKDGWNCYKYWMAETPFSPQCKPYRDRNECPSIHVSNDGISWHEINTNPIDDLDGEGVKNLDYFSDPHLVLQGNRIECWYRLSYRNGDVNNHSNIKLVRKTSYDGIHWGERECLVDFINEKTVLGKVIVSHAVIFKNDKYHMWYVDRERVYKDEKAEQREVLYSSSPNGKVWNNPIKCCLSGKCLNPWHIDVNFIDGKYWLICYDDKDISLWESKDGINYRYIKNLITTSVFGSFYSNNLYRAVMIKDDCYKLFFSANNSFQTFIGLMSGESPKQMEITSPDSKNFCSYPGLLNLLWKTYQRKAVFMTRNCIKKTIQHFK